MIVIDANAFQDILGNNAKVSETVRFTASSSFIIHSLIIIDLFSLYVLFPRCRSCDNTLGFVQISSYSRARVRLINEETKGQVPLGQSIWETKHTS